MDTPATPSTKRNPKWHRNEIILALELYFRTEPSSMHSKNPEIIALSESLNKLQIETFRPNVEKFRNPNGTALKLNNFKAIDPSYEGKGMKSYSKLDEEIFREFYEDRNRLKIEVSKIRNESLQSEIAINNELKIDYTNLESQYNLFLQFIKEQDSSFNSFDHPFIQKHESYKEKVVSNGREQLNVLSWKRSMIGTGKIIEMVKDAINVTDNNLLIHDDRVGANSRQDKSLYFNYNKKELINFESVIFNLYKDIDPDEVSFNRIINITGRIYPFISYLFFLKSSKKYLPIAPETFDKVFSKLGIAFKTSQKCSWENYSQYLHLLIQIRDFLELQEEIDDEEVSLLDAHSFSWILGSKNAMGNWHPKKLEERPIEILFKTITPQKRDIDEYILKDKGKVTNSDYDKKNKRNNWLGKKSEAIVLEYERKAITEAGREDLLGKIKDVSKILGKGYDIESITPEGVIKKIEVKTEGINSSFVMSLNEIQKSIKLDNYFIYVVANPESDKPIIKAFEVKDILRDLKCNPINYRVYF